MTVQKHLVEANFLIDLFASIGYADCMIGKPKPLRTAWAFPNLASVRRLP